MCKDKKGSNFETLNFELHMTDDWQEIIEQKALLKDFQLGLAGKILSMDHLLGIFYRHLNIKLYCYRINGHYKLVSKYQ